MSTNYTTGDHVYWFIAYKRIEGEVVDVFSRTNLAAGKHTINDSSQSIVLLIQLEDGRKVLKLANEVKPDKRGFV